MCSICMKSNFFFSILSSIIGQWDIYNVYRGYRASSIQTPRHVLLMRSNHIKGKEPNFSLPIRPVILQRSLPFLLSLPHYIPQYTNQMSTTITRIVSQPNNSAFSVE